MITSTTDLLNEIVSEAGPQSTSSRPKRPSQVSNASQKIIKKLLFQYECLQAMFLRCSWLRKLSLLTLMMQELKKIDSLSLILNTLMVSSAKCTIYGESQCDTDFVYDKHLLDHNRSLHAGTLMQTEQSAVEWFKTVDDSEQVLIVIGLIRLSGGAILHQLYKRGTKLYQQRLEKLESAETVSVNITEAKTETLKADLCNLDTQENLLPETHAVASQLPSLAPRNLSIKPDNMQEKLKYDPKDPYVVEVEKRRADWNATITKYRIEVEGKPAKGGKPKKGSSKNSKATKSTKKSKSTKSGKKGKKGKDGKGDQLDHIQLLPIWIVKKIFGYLDKKTLAKAKNVNSYWKYAIADMQKDQKARKYLDKFVKKLESSIVVPPLSLSSDQPHVLKEVYDTSSPAKRIQQLLKRGATLPKLHGELKEPLATHSLATAVAQQADESYILPFMNMESFPRSIAHAAPLYKTPSCVVNELGFRKVDYGSISSDRTTISSMCGTTRNVDGNPPVGPSKDIGDEEVQIS